MATFTRCAPGALLLCGMLAGPAAAQNDSGPYSRIGILLPHDGDTVDFEAGYIRHLEWHRQAHDGSTWYGWTISIGERQRAFVYATFGHPAADFDNAVSPAEDEADTIVNITPHAHFAGAGLYVFLPSLSRGAASPSPAARVELTTVHLLPGSEKAFEAALAAEQAALQNETLWYRMVAGGRTPLYVRLRPRATLAASIDTANALPLPDAVSKSIADVSVEILTLRPTMSYRLPPGTRRAEGWER